MDKFGIFSILNALTGILGANAPQTPTENGVKNLLQTPLSELFSSINSGVFKKADRTDASATSVTPLPPPAEKPPKSSYPPLSEKMLAAMKEHNEFVARVKEKQKKI